MSGSSKLGKFISNAKFDVEKFDGTNNFGMWQCEVMDILFQQELDITLGEKPKDISEGDWEKMNRQACNLVAYSISF